MAFFNKFKGRICEVVFSPKEQEAIDKEVTKQLRKEIRRMEMDFDASMLWMLHEVFGFGPVKLRKAWEKMYQSNRQYELYYNLDVGDGTWMCAEKLKEYGCDVKQWYKDANLL